VVWQPRAGNDQFPKGFDTLSADAVMRYVNKDVTSDLVVMSLAARFFINLGLASQCKPSALHNISGRESEQAFQQATVLWYTILTLHNYDSGTRKQL
jgi:hypothetical protein